VGLTPSSGEKNAPQLCAAGFSRRLEQGVLWQLSREIGIEKAG